MPHRPVADARHRGEHVVAPAVDLLLLVVEGVDRAWRELVEPDVYRRRIDPERLVRQAWKARVRLATGTDDRLDPGERVLGRGRSGAGIGEQQQKQGGAEDARHGGGLAGWAGAILQRF